MIFRSCFCLQKKISFQIFRLQFLSMDNKKIDHYHGNIYSNFFFHKRVINHVPSGNFVFLLTWVCNEKRLHFRFSLLCSVFKQSDKSNHECYTLYFSPKGQEFEMKKRKIWKYFTIIYTKHKCQLSNPRNCGKKKFDWPKISKTSQIALGEKIFRKKFA